MGTRSNIAAMVDGKVKVIYCHFDGYIEHVGQVLYDHYGSQDRAEELLALGDISALYERCDCPEGHTYGNAVKGYTIAYGRDRGEVGTEAKQFDSLDEWQANWGESWGEYFYYWDGSQWMVHDKYSEEQTEPLVPLYSLVEIKTDSGKLKILADQISGISFPEVESEESKHILSEVRLKLESSIDAIVSGVLTTN